MITIVNFGSSKTPLIAEMVSACGAENQIINWKDCNHGYFSGSDGIIFSGSPVMFTETDHAPYIEKFSFIKPGKIPVLGICFGHQLMGILHDAKIFRGMEVRTRIKIKVVKEDVLLNGLSPATEMNEDHTEGITLPPGFIHLASSSSYTIEAMRHPALPLWGVQFHPEVSGETGKILMQNFIAETNRAVVLR
ncbi:MAG: gamma-glutamyl-gamma-aminobutyrate hydrolase family protein [Bacteroidota bacterium]|nr:gamma-glutamyl-gamma-aminobutyrate hydrolase family protein [Bacteroidota bacterium]